MTRRLPSSSFRTTFPSLTDPTIVTVNGHAIAAYIPGDPATNPALAHLLGEPLVPSPDPTAMPRSVDDPEFIRPVAGGSFGHPRPAPKGRR
jgi:hypothetical protein